MDNNLPKILWQQFGASIEMLENAIMICPEKVWDGSTHFWYNTYHCLFFLDYYLTTDPVGFAPPLPFDLSEFEDRLPERVYTKEELLVYLEFCREKCRNLIFDLTEENIAKDWINESKTMVYPMVEILLYNMRHVQHHAAQLNLLLRQTINDATDWVRRADEVE